MPQHFYKQFFNQWESPPLPIPPPSDTALVQRIQKLADYASRNGPDFVSLFKDRQRQNPEYAFLVGGEGSEYYRWCLHCLLVSHPLQSGEATSGVDQKFIQRSQNLSSSEELLAEVKLPEEVGKAFLEVLNSLDGSKDSIKGAQNLFLKNSSMAEDLAKLMYLRIMELKDTQHQLHIFYVIDEILFKCLGDRHEEKWICEIFRPLIRPILSKIVSEGNQSEEVFRRLRRVLDSWYEDRMYDQEILDSFEDVLTTEGEDLTSFSRSKDHDKEPSYENKHTVSTLPPHMVSLLKSGRAEQTQTRAAFDPPPIKSVTGKKPLNVFSFPPGLIPKLISEKGRKGFSYSQISREDIEKAGSTLLADPNDPYLRSRLEKFYAELDEYRPGMVREHVESRKRADEVEVDTESRRRRQRTTYNLSEEEKHTSMLPDGTYIGEGSDSMYAGLGAHTQSKVSEEDTVFENYRKLRSDVYHNSIPKGATSTTQRRPR